MGADAVWERDQQPAEKWSSQGRTSRTADAATGPFAFAEITVLNHVVLRYNFTLTLCKKYTVDFSRDGTEHMFSFIKLTKVTLHLASSATCTKILFLQSYSICKRVLSACTRLSVRPVKNLKSAHLMLDKYYKIYKLQLTTIINRSKPQ